MRIGVVTVTYNSEQVLPDFIKSLATQEFADFTLIAVDNASSDSSVDVLEHAKASGLSMTVIANAENLGVAEGNNIGIREAIEQGCSHVLLLNNDTEFPTNLLSGLAACAAQGRLVVVPKIYRGERGKTLWYGGGKFARLRGYTGIHVGAEEQDRGQHDRPRIVEYAPTCCMLVRVDIFTSVGMMDARYFVYYDDTDFCLRLLRNKVPIWYQPRVILYHKVGSLTGGAVSPFAVRMLVRNRIYYLKKNFSPLGANAAALLYKSYLLLRWLLRKDARGLYVAKMAAIAEGRRMALAYESERRQSHETSAS